MRKLSKTWDYYGCFFGQSSVFRYLAELISQAFSVFTEVVLWIYPLKGFAYVCRRKPLIAIIMNVIFGAILTLFWPLVKFQMYGFLGIEEFLSFNLHCPGT